LLNTIEVAENKLAEQQQTGFWGRAAASLSSKLHAAEQQLVAAELQGRVAEASAAGAIKTVRELEKIRQEHERQLAAAEEKVTLHESKFVDKVMTKLVRNLSAKLEAAEQQLAAVRRVITQDVFSPKGAHHCGLAKELYDVLADPPQVGLGDRLTPEQLAPAAIEGFFEWMENENKPMSLAVVAFMVAVRDQHCPRPEPKLPRVEPADRLTPEERTEREQWGDFSRADPGDLEPLLAIIDRLAPRPEPEGDGGTR
jgi:hypothetical protein